jgi:hypothetical protein
LQLNVLTNEKRGRLIVNTFKNKKVRNEDESSEGVIMKEKAIREEEVERELTNQS